MRLQRWTFSHSAACALLTLLAGNMELGVDDTTVVDSQMLSSDSPCSRRVQRFIDDAVAPTA